MKAPILQPLKREEEAKPASEAVLLYPGSTAQIMCKRNSKNVPMMHHAGTSKANEPSLQELVFLFDL